MKISFCFALCIVLLAGCTTSRQTYLEDGEVGYSIKCSNFRSKSWDACYVMAGDICGERGYEMISKSGDGIYASRKNLWIKCK